MKTVIEMAREARVYSGCTEWTITKSDTFVTTHKAIERFAELVRADERNSWPAEMEAMERQVNILTDALAKARADEREAIMDDWWMCVQSDLENGVKSLNERAAEKWKKEYPEISKFAETIRARGNT